MDENNFALDRPENIDYNDVTSGQRWRLANQDIYCQADADCTLYNLTWPWANSVYARKIEFRISDPRDDELVPMWVRHYPAYHETISGHEGMIVSKQLLVPLKSHYDRGLLWLLECQAEGDRLLRVEVDIQWDQPLTQRMVDGLLVAQENPRRAQGIYEQCNADSTRLFGNPEARPDQIEIAEEKSHQARLVYHVLINGLVTVPFILVISDVGEQVAWNGFLALRDGRHVFRTSNRNWDTILQTGRLWTSAPSLNWAVQQGRISTLRHCQRLRTGLAPSDRMTIHVPLLIDSFDTFDPIQSRNLLAHLRRVAEKTDGRLPILLPLRPKETAIKPAQALAQTNCAYLQALYNHLQRYYDHDLLAEHRQAIHLCAEALLQYRQQQPDGAETQNVKDLVEGLTFAYQLIEWLDPTTSEITPWLETAESYQRLYETTDDNNLSWQSVQEIVNSKDIWQQIALAGWTHWQGCGLRYGVNKMLEECRWPADWEWWALTDLYVWDADKPQLVNQQHKKMNGQGWSLLYHNETLYTSQPIQSRQSWLLCTQIETQNIDELEFNLQFALTLAETGEEHIVTPDFL